MGKFPVIDRMILRPGTEYHQDSQFTPDAAYLLNETRYGRNLPQPLSRDELAARHLFGTADVRYDIFAKQHEQTVLFNACGDITDVRELLARESGGIKLSTGVVNIFGLAGNSEGKFNYKYLCVNNGEGLSVIFLGYPNEADLTAVQPQDARASIELYSYPKYKDQQYFISGVHRVRFSGITRESSDPTTTEKLIAGEYNHYPNGSSALLRLNLSLTDSDYDKLTEFKETDIQNLIYVSTPLPTDESSPYVTAGYITPAMTSGRSQNHALKFYGDSDHIGVPRDLSRYFGMSIAYDGVNIKPEHIAVYHNRNGGLPTRPWQIQIPLRLDIPNPA